MMCSTDQPFLVFNAYRFTLPAPGFTHDCYSVIIWTTIGNRCFALFRALHIYSKVKQLKNFFIAIYLFLSWSTDEIHQKFYFLLNQTVKSSFYLFIKTLIWCFVIESVDYKIARTAGSNVACDLVTHRIYREMRQLQEYSVTSLCNKAVCFGFGWKKMLQTWRFGQKL